MATSYFQERVESPIAENGDHILSPTTPSTAAPRSTALQNRVTSVLSASYADLEIRDALSILDQRGIPNTAETRRNLRLDVQQELIQCNGDVVRDFGQVAAQLKRIGTAIEKLNGSCAEMRRHIGAANRETGPMLDDAKTILADKRHTENKQQLLDAFQTHFVVSEDDITALTSMTEPVDDRFFRILGRVKRVHRDSQVLLGTENQRLGLEILEQSSRNLNAAFQKLFRWVQREFKSLDLENPQLSAAIRRALRVLAERPTLFQHCLDAFAEARENILSSSFHAALTGAPLDSDHPVMGKAIELSAHDPLRYISDMFAWAHSASVSEREALEGLFISDGDEIAKTIKAGKESEPWSRVENAEDAPVFDGRKALNELVERDLLGVFRQLRQRTEQVVQSHEDAIMAYKISNLVTFYSNVFSAFLGEDSNLLDTLRPLSETAMRSFRSIMRDHVTNLQTDLSITPDDLAPPEFLTEALSSLDVLMKSYDTSMATTNHTQRSEGFQPILQDALDPFLAGCENISKALQPPKKQIFALNCLLMTNATLKKFTFADRSEELQPRIEEHVMDLTEAMLRWFSTQSGLQSLEARVATADDLASLYNDPTWLMGVSQQLDAFLPTATDDARTFLDQLEDSTLGTRVIDRAAEKFCEDFESMERLIIEADEIRERAANGDVEGDVLLRDIFPRTSDEIRVLLS